MHLCLGRYKQFIGSKNAALLAWLIIVVISAVLPYAHSLDGEFVLDDQELIVNNPIVHNLSNLPRAFATHYLVGWADTESQYYRPLTTVSFQINYALSGLDPAGFRLSSLIFHVINSVLVMLIAFRLTDSVLAAGVAGIAFGVQSSHAESVAWISGRTDLLAALFTLAAMLFFLAGQSRSRQGFSWSLGLSCSVLTLCAMLAKESALILPGLFLMYIWAFGSRVSKKSAIGWFFVVVPSGIIYLMLRKEVLGTLTSGIELDYLLKERMLRLGIVYSTYLWMLFVPHNCRFLYGHVTKNMTFTTLDIALLGVPVALVGIAIWLAKRVPVAAFSLGWIITTLVPASDFIHANTLLPAERFVYLPSVGSSILLGWLFSRAWNQALKTQNSLKFRASLVVLAAVWIFAFAFFALINSLYYESNLAWARRVTQTNPKHRAFRELAARFYEEAGEAQAALRECEAIIDISSKRLSRNKEAVLRYNLGMTYAKIGDMVGAARAFAEVVELKPNVTEAWRDLGRAELRLGRFRKAIKAFERYTSMATPNLRDHLELGQAYKGAGEKAKAVAQFRYVISKDPGSELAQRAALELKSM